MSFMGTATTRRIHLPQGVAAGLLAAALTLVFAAPVQAQVATGKGRLDGIVQNAAGEFLEGATITLTYVATGESWDVTSNRSGRWVKGNMGSGRWNLDITAPGYQASALSVTVRQQRGKPVVSTLAAAVAGAGEAAAGGSVVFPGELGDRVTAADETYGLGDFAAALTEYEAILAEYGAKENPNAKLYLIHVNAGNAAIELQDPGNAERHFQAALAADATDERARLGMARLYMADRKLDEALAELDQLDLATIQDPIVFYNIGNLLFDQGQSADAQKYYALSLARDPNSADAHMQMGLSLIQQGLMVEARPHLERVVELDPESQNAALAQEFLGMIG